MSLLLEIALAVYGYTILANAILHTKWKFTELVGFTRSDPFNRRYDTL